MRSSPILGRAHEADPWAIVLALATGFLGFLMGDWNKRVNYPDPDLYRPALYSLHVQAVDSVSGAVLDFRLGWDKEQV